jgi:hypothetical protein
MTLTAENIANNPCLPEDACGDEVQWYEVSKRCLSIVWVVKLYFAGEVENPGQVAPAVLSEGSYQLKSARGGLINEAAVSAAYNAGKLAGGWMEVYTHESCVGSQRSCPQALLTPHAAPYTPGSAVRTWKYGDQVPLCVVGHE